MVVTYTLAGRRLAFVTGGVGFWMVELVVAEVFPTLTSFISLL